MCTRQERNAFTLVELMMAVGVGSLVLLVVASLILFSARSVASISNYTGIIQSSRSALDHISKEIRRTRGLMAATTNTLVFRLNTPGTDTLTYVYNQPGRTLTQIKAVGANVETNVLLDDCTYWKHQIFQRTPKSNSFSLFPAAEIAQAKLIQVDWTCGRARVNTTNTENVQSMKIVIRKRVN